MTDSSTNTARIKELMTFFQAFDDNAVQLEPGHPFYVPVFDDSPDTDPVEALKSRILFSVSESVNLLTGFRGNGKTTQLKRLRKLLEDAGCRVFYVNMRDYMLMTQPVELSDLLLSITAALSRAVKADNGLNVIERSYWERMKEFLTSQVISDGVTFSAGIEDFSAEMGVRLQRDAGFKEKIQHHLRGHATTIVEEARSFFASIVTTLRQRSGSENLKVVLLIDSLEQIRGHFSNANDVQKSVSEIFSGQAGNLLFPMLHIVYTIPPYLSTLAPNISKVYGGNPITCWPNIHVRKKDGEPDPRGEMIMRSIVEKRYPAWRNYFEENHISRLAQSSGGDLRDYFRLVRECVIALSTSKAIEKVDDAILTRTEQQLLSESLPIAIDDARWLLRISEEKTASLEVIGDVSSLVRFQDGNLIMNYQNGEIWCDIHPLLLPEVKKLAALPRRTGKE